MLTAFRASLPSYVSSLLKTSSSRNANGPNIESVHSRGHALWHNIHSPFTVELEHRLGKAHPDLPLIIINDQYGSLFADPEGTTGTAIGSIATSLLAIACLRAQRNVNPQLQSHLVGLRKMCEESLRIRGPDAERRESLEWLASDEGCIWVLTKVDEVVGTIEGVRNSTSAPKL
jgi:hypothetical protein